MKITLYHGLTIHPTPGYEIREIPLEDIDGGFADGSISISIWEDPIKESPGDIEVLRNTIIQLQEKVPNERVSVSAEKYEKRIQELGDSLSRVTNELILVKGTKRAKKMVDDTIKGTKKRFYRERVCACGCGKKFTPTGPYAKYHPKCSKVVDLTKAEKRNKKSKTKKKMEVKLLSNILGEDLTKNTPETSLENVESTIIPEPIVFTSCEECAFSKFCGKYGDKCSVDNRKYFRPIKTQ